MAILAGYWALMTFVPNVRDRGGILCEEREPRQPDRRAILARAEMERRRQLCGQPSDARRGSFLAHAVGLLLAVALAGLLYRRKIFLRV